MTAPQNPDVAGNPSSNEGPDDLGIDWDSFDQDGPTDVTQQAETTQPVTEATAAPKAQPAGDDEDYEFPVLSSMLETYFATGKELLFLERYERYGEETHEFSGLQDDMRKAILKPKRAAQEVNRVLQSDLEPQDVRAALVELLDQITQSGAFSPEAIEQAEEEERNARPAPEDLLGYYFTRKVHLPASFGKVGRIEFPLWSVLAAGFVIIGLGLGIGKLPLPGFLQWITGMFSVVGLLLVGFSAVAMLGLRNEMRNPEREEEKRAAREEAEEKKAKKRERRERLWM